MGASGTVAKEQEVEFKALEGSLSMMSKGVAQTLTSIFVGLLIGVGVVDSVE